MHLLFICVHFSLVGAVVACQSEEAEMYAWQLYPPAL